VPSASAPSQLARRANPNRALCGAKTKSAGACKHAAGFGTDHVGRGHCKHHGGCTPSGIVHAARLEADALALEYQCEPHEALLRAVGQAAKWELVCRLKVAALDDEQLVVVTEKEAIEYTPVLRREGEGDDTTVVDTGVTIVERKVTTASTAHLHVWVKSHQQAIRDLASIAKTAIDAGVDERRVRVAEALGDQIADVLGAIFNELDLTAEQRRLAQPVVRRHLVALEGGQAA
jgi:nucleotide-binding universal stress UspA family protein